MLNAIMISALAMLAGAVTTLSIPAQDWPGPPQAEVVTRNRLLADLVRRVDGLAGSVLLIRHAGGDADTGRAEALRDVLVALGLPSARIRLVAAAAPVNELIIEVAENGETGP